MAIHVNHITVSFPGIRALDGVALSFENGRVHGVLGANGSGKSTLVKVLTGVYQPDENCGSEIRIEDSTVAKFTDPAASRSMGISVVHQEAPLIHSLSVAESIALFKGYPKTATGLVDWKKLEQNARELFAFHEIQVDPKRMVSSLSASERGMVSMAIALGKDEDLKRTKALILDEADASIPEGEAERFLEHVRRIAEFGIPVIMVTHRLKAVHAICDDVTILNDGKVTFTGPITGITQEQIIAKMLRQDQIVPEAEKKSSGSELPKLWELGGRGSAESAANEPALKVENLVADNLEGLSFEVARGEVLGIVGIADSGVNELPLVLFGDGRIDGGSISVYGKQLPRRMTPRRAIRSGLMLQPADRLRQGGVMSLSLRDNLQMPDEMSFWHKGKKDRAVVDKAIYEFDVRPRMSNMPFGKFSGGNQQKAIIAKWLKLHPSVLIMDDPTYGVDPAARKKIFSSIEDASANGVAIVVFSTEPEQLVNVCTRIIVLSGGKIAKELYKADGSLTRETIARWCYA